MADFHAATILDTEHTVQLPGRPPVVIDRSRDALLTEFGKATLSDRYLLAGEDFQDLFARVASYYGDILVSDAFMRAEADEMRGGWANLNSPISGFPA